MSSVRTVPSATYTNAIIVLFVMAALLGSMIYTEYRISVRIMLQDYRMHMPEGAVRA